MRRKSKLRESWRNIDNHLGRWGMYAGEIGMHSYTEQTMLFSHNKNRMIQGRAARRQSTASPHHSTRKCIQAQDTTTAKTAKLALNITLHGFDNTTEAPCQNGVILLLCCVERNQSNVMLSRDGLLKRAYLRVKESCCWRVA